jgi:CPA1 family monovalent cation:H+ antiporter
MPPVEFCIALLVAVAGLARLAGALDVPYPVLLVLGGLGLGLIPGLPTLQLEPDVVLLVFLPPLVYHAAFLTSPRELRAHALDIGALAVGLVLLTMGVVAVATHAVIGGLSWPEAFVLGAIVAPTDPIAATAVFRRLRAPDSLTTVVEGEALVNDGTALVAFRVALAAVTGGEFAAGHAAGQFVLSALGGVAVGLAAGHLAKRVRQHVDDPPVEITISLFTPYLAYLPAERIDVSGVLAAVAAGLYLAYQSPTGLFSASTRLQAFAFWDVLVFLLNSLLFVIVGLQIRPVIDALGDRSAAELAGGAALTVGAVIATRAAWLLVGHGRSFGERVVIAWSGMRGAVSLAAALSVPTDAPGRPLIVFLTFATILVTLVGQGLTLPAVVRRFAPEDTGTAQESEENARIQATQAALEHLDQIAGRGELSDHAVKHARHRYELRLNHLTDREDPRELPVTRDLQKELAGTERETIERLHADGHLDQETARRLERELDLEEERWGQLEGSSLS